MTRSGAPAAGARSAVVRAAVVAWVVALFASPSAMAAEGSVKRLIAELRQCDNVEIPNCRSLTVRLANYGKHVVKPIAKVFDDLSPAAQILALGALGAIEHPGSTRLLIRLSAKSTFAVRGLAFAALAEREGRSVDRALLAGLSAREATIRAAAAEALGKARPRRDVKRVVPRLVEAATNDDTIDVRVIAVESLGMLGDPAGVPAMRAGLHHRDPRLRKTALFALRFMRDARAVPDVMELLKDDDRITVQDAGRALENMTGMAFGTDYELWKGWWEDQKQAGDKEPR